MIKFCTAASQFTVCRTVKRSDKSDDLNFYFGLGTEVDITYMDIELDMDNFFPARVSPQTTRLPHDSVFVLRKLVRLLQDFVHVLLEDHVFRQLDLLVLQELL